MAKVRFEAVPRELVHDVDAQRVDPRRYAVDERRRILQGAV